MSTQDMSVQIATKGPALLTEARDVLCIKPIETDDQNRQIAEKLKEVKALQKDAESYFDPIVTKAKATWDEGIAQRKRALAPLVEAEGLLKKSLGTYALLLEAREREAEAVRIREAREAEERDRLARAAEQEAAGETQAAAQTLETPRDHRDFKVAAGDAPAPSKVAGVSTTAKYTAEVRSLDELVAAIAAGKAPIECVQANQSALNKIASSFKRDGGALLYPGVVSVREIQVAAGRGRGA